MTHAWDASWIPRLLGASMIVQRIKVEADGQEREEEFWGVVIDVSPSLGVTLALRGQYSGQTWPLPAGPGALAPAPDGPFILRTTGDLVDRADDIATLVQKAA